MIKKEYQEIIIATITKHIPSCKIYLFGSRARKKHAPGSDIDLAIDSPQKIDRHLLCKIKEELEDANIPFFIDIVDLQSADNEIKSQIDKDKVLWSS